MVVKCAGSSHFSREDAFGLDMFVLVITVAPTMWATVKRGC